MPALSAAALAALRDVVGGAQLLTDPDATAGYAVDWTGRFRGAPAAVARPADTAEVAAVLRACHDHGVPVVPQGGNTGLVGGGVPLHGEFVVYLGRLVDVGEPEPAGVAVSAGAGASIEAVQQAARSAGRRYAVDLASRGSATVGGTVATNAGGLRVLRYGDTRAQLLGVEAVLADGTVLSHLRPLPRDNTGYHLPALLCGSEGTLAVLTRARLRLWPRRDRRAVALVGFASTAEAVRAATAVAHAEVDVVEAAELMLAGGVELVCRATGLPPPFPAAHPAYLLVEAAGTEPPVDELAGLVGALSGVRAVAVAEDAAGVERLWAYRERHTEAVNTLGPPHKYDLCLPADVLAEFLESCSRRISALRPQARVWVFGHAAEATVHLNVTGVAPDDAELDELVLAAVGGHGGSVSAEHGIGTLKRRWLALSRTPAEIATFRTLKHALDPAGILNPHVLLPPP